MGAVFLTVLVLSSQAMSASESSISLYCRQKLQKVYEDDDERSMTVLFQKSELLPIESGFIFAGSSSVEILNSKISLEQALEEFEGNVHFVLKSGKTFVAKLTVDHINKNGDLESLTILDFGIAQSNGTSLSLPTGELWNIKPHDLSRIELRGPNYTVIYHY